MRHFVSSSKRLLLRRQVLKERGCFRPALGCQLKRDSGTRCQNHFRKQSQRGVYGLISS